MLTANKSSKIISGLLVVVLICSFMTISAFARQGGFYGIVNGNSVRLRTSMDTSNTNNVVGLLNSGERLNITQEYDAWAYGVMADGGNVGKCGYVSKSYLTLHQQ